MSAKPPLPGFVENLNRLLTTVCWPGVKHGKPAPVGFNDQILADAICAAGFPISSEYIGQCRRGEIANPAAYLVDRMAAAFDGATAVEVPTMYFFRADVARKTNRALDDERERIEDQIREAAGV